MTATQHVHGRIKIFFKKRQGVSTSHFNSPADRQCCISKAILKIGHSFRPRDINVHQNFAIFKVSPNMFKKINNINFFTQTMNRSQRLHTSKYDTKPKLEEYPWLI